MKLEKRNDDLSVVRGEGLVPGVIYGHGIEPQNIQANYKELVHEYQSNGYSMSFEVKLGKDKHIVFLKEIQRDLINPNDILHFDLMKVNAEDIMTASIPIHYIGRHEVEKRGLIVQVLSDTLDFEFPVTKGVSSINIDITNLEAGDSIIAQAIDVPKGFEMQEDLNKVLVNVTLPKIENEETETIEDVVMEEPVEEEVTE